MTVYTGPTPASLALPYDAWQPEQWETIVRLASSEKKYICLEAPTGAGKSGIVVGLAGLCDWQILIATGTKQLQDQYHTSLGIQDVRGRNNFPCLIEPVTADVAPCTVGASCPHKTLTRHLFYPPVPHEGDVCESTLYSQDGSDYCPYYLQRYQADSADRLVVNYAYWLAMSNYAGALRSRDLVVFDEAHTLEDEIRRFATVGFSRKRLGLINVQPCWESPDNIAAWQAWAGEYRERLAREYFSITKNLAGPVTDSQDDQRRRAIVAFVRAADLFRSQDASSWVGETDPKYGRTEFKPIWVGGLTRSLVYRHLEDSQKVIFMSGTILDAGIFADQLGLDPDDVDFVQMPSTFEPSRRPFYYSPIQKGSYRDPEHVKKVVTHLDTLIDLHPDEKGIIHTVSHALANQIIRQSRHTTRMIGHETSNKAVQLDWFRRSDNGIWVSPSSHMGVDLPYDLCRWQILAKLPFPNLADKQVKQMMKVLPDGKPAPKSSAWYNWATLCSVMQAYGRGMRAPDDSCSTYLIDSNWKWFRSATRKWIPAWFSQAFKPAPLQEVAPVTDIDAMFARLGIGKK